MTLAEILNKICDIIEQKYGIELPGNTFLQVKDKVFVTGRVFGMKIEVEYKGNYYYEYAMMVRITDKDIDEFATKFGIKLQKGSIIQQI